MMSNKPYFDDVADEWDQMRKSFFSEAVREKALATAGVQRGKIAADIGAGTGFITEALVNEGVAVVAIDQSEAMLDAMKKKFVGIQGVDFRLGEAENLPIPGDSVDYAFANMYLHHVEIPLKAIKEMVRILKPGGKLVLTDLDEHDYDFLRTEQHDRWMGFKREDVNRWLTEAGLKAVVVDCADEDCCAQSSCGCDDAVISIFIASGQK